MREERFKSFYKDKRILITGHTGFKGTWLTKLLLRFGAQVTGYALEPNTQPNLFDLSGIRKHKNFTHLTGDVRDLPALEKVFKNCKPEIVFHLAAQPIVRESYKDPVGTYSTNVMGTVNVLECIRTTQNADGAPTVRSFLNVTTDKVYQNKEWCWGYRENEPLDGYDPYSNSKSCSELVTHSYRNSFFSNSKKEALETGKPLLAISTARAGNVIGGGDFASDRIIPDAVRAMEEAFCLEKENAVVNVRNPYSTRPYQHVLEPLQMYLTIAMKQYEDAKYAGYYNVGPDDCDCVTTGQLAELFCKEWNKKSSDRGKWPLANWISHAEPDAPHEANFLKLDCSRIKYVFGWQPVWHIDRCIEETVEFAKAWLSGRDIAGEMDREINGYFDVD